MADKQQAAVGAFVLCGVVIAIGAVIVFGRFHIFEHILTAEVVFEGSISGLVTGAPVTFRGVNVGTVSSVSIEYDPQNNTAYIPVHIKLDNANVIVLRGAGVNSVTVEELVHQGMRAELNTVSFVTGQSEVALDFQPAVPPLFHPNIADAKEIPAVKSFKEKLMDQISQLPLREIADNANQLIKSVHGLADTLSEKLPPLIDTATATSDKAGRTIDVAAGAIKDLQARLDTDLTDIDRLVATGDKQLSARGAELHTLLVSSNQTISDAHDVLVNIKSLTNDRAAARANLEAALNDIATAAAALRGFASDVEHNPQLLLTGRRQ